MLLEEQINEIGFLCEDIKGTSMTPLFKSGRDKVYIEKLKGKPKKGDILLYKRLSGEYVLHRVVKVQENTFTACGDNHLFLEHGIRFDQIIGVCVGYCKYDRYVDFKKSIKYKLYKTFWGSNRFNRKVIGKIKALGSKIKRIFK